MSDANNSPEETSARPFLSVDELRATRVSEVRKGGLDPAEVALLIERAAVTFQALLNAIDALHAERASLISDVDDAKAVTTEPASATAARVINAAAEAAESITRSAQADAELIVAQAQAARDNMVEELSALEAEHARTLHSHQLEVNASREAANAELARLHAQLALWRDDFSTRAKRVVTDVTEVFSRAEAFIDAPLGTFELAPNEAPLTPENDAHDDAHDEPRIETTEFASSDDADSLASTSDADELVSSPEQMAPPTGDPFAPAAHPFGA